MKHKNDDLFFEDEYDELEEQKDLLENRENFRITKCCGNCRHFLYSMGSQRRGMCMINPPKLLDVYRNDCTQRKNFITARDNDTWPKTHITCICDSHRISGHSRSFKAVKKYCKAEYRVEDDL
jgi:hypothetical protein|tara:strand:- start:29 stop:397 length:369 start_codon:yes stop_codon:yes gene_type:complete